MPPFISILSDTAVNFSELAEQVLRACETSSSNRTNTQALLPLIDGIKQFLKIAGEMDDASATDAPLGPAEVTQVGDYGLALLAQLDSVAEPLELPDVRVGIGRVVLTSVDWIARHHAEVQSLEPVVNALALEANNSTDAKSLESLTNFTDVVVGACASFIKSDLEKLNPGRPWRLLHLNRGIVATRTHNPKLMTKVFDQLLDVLPEDAPQFFVEGMQEMDKLNYPLHVREVMQHYFDRWSRPTMN